MKRIEKLQSDFDSITPALNEELVIKSLISLSFIALSLGEQHIPTTIHIITFNRLYAIIFSMNSIKMYPDRSNPSDFI